MTFDKFLLRYNINPRYDEVPMLWECWRVCRRAVLWELAEIADESEAKAITSAEILEIRNKEVV